MEAIIEKEARQQTGHTAKTRKQQQTTGAAWYGLASQARAFDEARFGWMAILLTLQSCIGAVACMLVSIHSTNILLLAACAAVTMGSNALFIALASARACVIGFYLSVVVNLLLMLIAL